MAQKGKAKNILRCADTPPLSPLPKPSEVLSGESRSGTEISHHISHGDVGVEQLLMGLERRTMTVDEVFHAMESQLDSALQLDVGSQPVLPSAAETLRPPGQYTHSLSHGSDPPLESSASIWQDDRSSTAGHPVQECERCMHLELQLLAAVRSLVCLGVQVHNWTESEKLPKAKRWSLAEVILECLRPCEHLAPQLWDFCEQLSNGVEAAAENPESSDDEGDKELEKELTARLGSVPGTLPPSLLDGLQSDFGFGKDEEQLFKWWDESVGDCTGRVKPESIEAPPEVWKWWDSDSISDVQGIPSAAAPRSAPASKEKRKATVVQKDAPEGPASNASASVADREPTEEEKAVEAAALSKFGKDKKEKKGGLFSKLKKK